MLDGLGVILTAKVVIGQQIIDSLVVRVGGDERCEVLFLRCRVALHAGIERQDDMPLGFRGVVGLLYGDLVRLEEFAGGRCR